MKPSENIMLQLYFQLGLSGRQEYFRDLISFTRKAANNLENSDFGISIGPKTQESFGAIIGNQKHHFITD